MAYLRARVPAAEVAEALAEAFPHGLPVPEPFGSLALLPWRGVIVTGFDDLWDRALAGDVDVTGPAQRDADRCRLETKLLVSRRFASAAAH